MIAKLDPDKLRERISVFLDRHTELPPTTWAVYMGIAPKTLFNFLHGAHQANKTTLTKVSHFLDDREQTENQRRLELNKQLDKRLKELQEERLPKKG